MELGSRIQKRMSQQQLQKAHEMHPTAQNVVLYDAPCVIYCCTLRGSADYAIFDLGLACENLMLEAETLGTVPLRSPIKLGADLITESFSIPPEHELFIAIAIGYRSPTSTEKAKPRKLAYATYVE